jgi:hypothetical protein
MFKPFILASLCISALFGQTIDTNPRGLTSIVFANLGTPANGTIVYCSDCTQASPTASGGTGAVVRRENGAWNGNPSGGGLSGLSTNTIPKATSATTIGNSSIVETSAGVFTLGGAGFTINSVGNPASIGGNGNSLNIGANAGGSAVVISTNTTVVSVNSAGLSLQGVGMGLLFKSGSNARFGTGTLSGGTLAVANTSITANSFVFVQDTGGGVIANIGALYVASQTAGVGFTVSSSNAIDTSTFRYWIFEAN